ncbi:MAG: type VI secretion system baseplate subunit TssE [Planctomycetaceae bacterium]
MSDRPNSDQPLKSSILDRLFDEDPTVSKEPVPSQGQILRELRQSVRRDLENLLNTRYRCVSWPPDLDQLDDSLVNYGIPDFTSAGYDAGEDSSWLLSAIEFAIRTFEPRVTKVRVKPIRDTAQLDRTLRFRIDAVLNVDPVNEPVRYDSSLDASSGQFSVRGVI